MRKPHLSILLGILISLLTFESCRQPSAVQSTGPEIPSGIPWSQRMAETLMHDFPEVWQMEEGEAPHWAYTKGLVCDAFLALWETTGEQRYFEYALDYADTMINEEGVILGYEMEDFNIDKINPGKMLFTLYRETEDPKYELAMKTLRLQLVDHPRTEAGGFWHKLRYPHQMWLDGLYMGGVFYTRYGLEYDEPASVDEAVHWITLMEEKSRDPRSGLLYHAWDESREQLWADKETGLSPHFWGRAMGWYGMAVVDMLDYLDEHPGREDLIAITQRMAEAICRVQDEETGCWYQVMDMPGEEGNYLEGSVTAMLSYFLLKAVREEYIDATYLENAKKAYEGMLEHLITVRDDGGVVLTPVCAVAGLGGDPYRDGSFEYYVNEQQRDNDPKGVGPFILASILYEDL